MPPRVRQEGRGRPGVRDSCLLTPGLKPTGALLVSVSQTATPRPPLLHCLSAAQFLEIFEGLWWNKGTVLSSRGRTAEARLGVQTWVLLPHLPMTSHLPFLLKSLSMLCPRPCPPLWEVLPKLLMPLISQPSSHPDSVTLSPIGYCWPALVLVCELVQAGIVSVLVNAVSSWCLVIVTCITGGTDRSRVPSAPCQP